MTPVESLLAKLPNARKNGTGWSAKCPAHDDGRASLSISQGHNGGAVLHCHAGCEPATVVAAVGLSLADLMPVNGVNVHGISSGPKTTKVPLTRNGRPAGKTFVTAADAVAELERQHGPRSALWTYHDAHGEPVGLVVRWNTTDGKKDIRPVSRDVEGWRIGGMPEPRPLYGLPVLAGAKRVYVCEGEKAADAARSIGLVATTSAQGSQSADKADWQPMAGKEVVILPDNDSSGRKYADAVAAILAKLTPVVVIKVVELHNLPDGGDIVEWIEAHGDAAEPDTLRAALEQLAAAAPLRKPVASLGNSRNDARSVPVLVRMADVQPEPVRWLWPRRIALGKLTLLAGDPGLGKSLITIDIAARVSRGCPWPDEPSGHAAIGGVVLLTAEDDLADTVRPRLDAAGADVSPIVVLQATEYHDFDARDKRERVRRRPFVLELDMPALEEAIVQTPDCRLVVIDPISAYLGHADSHKNADVRAVLAPLSELAAQRDVAVVAVTHLRKGEGAAMYRAMGSLAFVAAARAVFAIAKDKTDPRQRLMLPVKCNLASDMAGLAYTLIPSHVPDVPMLAWSRDPVTMTADEAIGAGEQHSREEGPFAEAQEWLRDVLARDQRPAKEILKLARMDGVAQRTLYRAKDALCVKSSRDGFGGPWIWALPEALPTVDCQAPDTHPLATYGDVGNLRENTEENGRTSEGDGVVGTHRLPKRECLEAGNLGNADDDWGEI